MTFSLALDDGALKQYENIVAKGITSTPFFTKESHHEDDIVESIQTSISYSQDIKGLVSCSVLQSSELCYKSFDDLEKEEYGEEPLDLVTSSFKEHGSHEIENIDALFHTKKLGWDRKCFCFEGDPIYDIYDMDSRAKSADFGALGQHCTIDIFGNRLMMHEQPYYFTD